MNLSNKGICINLFYNSLLTMETITISSDEDEQREETKVWNMDDSSNNEKRARRGNEERGLNRCVQRREMVEGPECVSRLREGVYLTNMKEARMDDTMDGINVDNWNWELWEKKKDMEEEEERLVSSDSSVEIVEDGPSGKGMDNRLKQWIHYTKQVHKDMKEIEPENEQGKWKERTRKEMNNI